MASFGGFTCRPTFYAPALAQPLISAQDRSFLPKKQQEWTQKWKLSIFVAFLEEKQQWNPVLWCEVNVRRAGGWQWSRCLERLMNYLGSLTPSPLPSQHPHKAIVLFANQTYWRTWGTQTYWGTCRLATFFPSTRAPPVVWCCAMEPRHNKETVDPFRRQSINLFCQQ